VGAVAAAIFTTGISTAAIPTDGEIAFQVLRENSDIGSHSLSFRLEGNDLHVKVAIDLEVGFGPITLFEYSHRNHEIWRDGRLFSLESETNDDGDKYRVRVRRDGEKLLVKATSMESYHAPMDAIPTSYWHPETVTQTHLLNTQTGEMVEVEITPRGEESIAVGGEDRPAMKYEVSGDQDLQLWYEPSGQPIGQLLKLAFNARGSEIDYKRLQPAGETVTLQAFRASQ
jgi:hypothetical protein